MKRIMQSLLILSLFLSGGLFLKGMESFQSEPEDVLSIYPNPTTGPMHISFTTESRLKPDAFILDMTGKQVKAISENFSFSADAFRADVDVSEMKPGIFFLKIQQGQAIHLQKFIVK
jgi:hypothetical protein